ncbi:MAG: polysaccharide deacetylase family protein [Calditrichia bacterium]
MPRRILLYISILSFAAINLFSQTHKMALTFDDLPVGKSGGYTLAQMHNITDSLLSVLAKDTIPAIGFVNEKRLLKFGEVDERIQILQKWLDAGLDLGNHTFSHPSLFNTDLVTYQEDLLLGEPITRKLLDENNKELRYFRHPFLNTGPTAEIRDAFHSWLAARGYTIAFVTIDNSEWIFNAAFDRAQGIEAKQKVGEAYIDYMDKQTAFCEYVSRELLGYNLPHTMLLHANRINAHYLDELIEMWQKRGYQFIPIDEALKDPAYQMSDNYAGRSGVTWLYRWAYGTEKQQAIDWRSEPEVPEFVLQLYSLR